MTLSNLPKKVSHALALSGGLDSTSVLCYLIQVLKIPVSEIACFYFLTGSRQSDMERKAIKSIEDYFKLRVTFYKIPMQYGKSDLNNQNQISGTADKAGMEQVIVPGRNILFISTMLNLLYSNDYKNPSPKNPCTIIFGAHAQDDKFPDCREEFIKPLNEAIKYSTGEAVKLSAPFVNTSKKELAKHCDKNLIENTYSCYEGTDPACGICMTCKYREEALSV